MSENLSLEEALHILRTETVTHGNDQVRVIDVLYMLSRGISAKSEKEQDLQSKINNILNLLSSDDVSLDEFQEIVNFIKANKSKLDNLSVPNIAGLAEALAEKVNANAEGLTPENITKWKEKLGVGELPSNIATIDEGNKQGNTYTKEKVDELLSGSAGGGNGKNLANADLQIPAGTVRTLDVTGAKFNIKGLNNKTRDKAFNRRLMVNESGEISYNNESDINIAFPTDFKASLTVNHIYPTNIPERPAFAEDLQRVLSKHKNYDLTPITDWVVKIIDDVDAEEIVRKSTYGKLQIYTDNPKLSKYKGVKVVDAFSENVVLPRDKNWLFKMSGVVSGSPISSSPNTLVGLSRDKLASSVAFGFQNGDWGRFRVNGNNTESVKDSFTCLFAKAGGVIATVFYSAGKVYTDVKEANLELGDFYPKILLDKGSFIETTMYYKILED
nr:MAG TPA: hypothetical protein [Caudoviricetes sp.]